MMKTCFETWCTDNYRERAGLDKQQNSLKYFHPDVPRYLFTTADTDRVIKKYNWPDLHYFMMPIQTLERELYNDYDLVVHIDSDCTITGSLDELLEGDFDIACVRNNTDHGTAGCCPYITINDPYAQNEIPWQTFCNAGFIASTKKEFWHDWYKANKKYGMNHPGHEQDILNCIINSGRYNVKLLDPIGSSVSYGVSNAWGPIEDFQKGIFNHWESWKDIYLDGDKLMLNTLTDGHPMEVKVMHVAGGYNARHMKQDYEQYGFSDEVLARLKVITSGE